jgi:6-phosphogluconolactonase (cycloisomerase 2 family)
MKRALIAFVCLIVVILASACGGGGGGGGTVTNGGVNGGNGGNNGGNGGTTSTLSQFLYVGNRGANPNGTITVYEMFTGGALTEVGIPEATQITPTGLAASGDGNYLYVSRISPAEISQFQIEPGGSLTPLSVPSVGTGGAAWSIIAHPTKNTVYVPDATNNRIYQFAITAGGLLQPLSPAFLATSSDPRYTALHPSGDVLYVVCRDGSVVDQFNVTGDGSLAPHATASVAAGIGASSITLTNNGLYAYVACELSMNIHQYKVNVATKSLEANGTTFTGVKNLAGMVYNDEFFYTADYEGTLILQYAIQPLGTLSPLLPATKLAGEGPMPIFVAPGTNFAYIANQSDGTIWHYSISPAGQLTFVKSYTTDEPGSTPASFAHVNQTP